VKLGIFGGTFDPVHRGHIAVAAAAAERFGLGRVLLIPSGSPPHKLTPAGAPYEDRYRMVELACADEARLEPSRLEAPDGDPEPDYSIDTIERVRAGLAPGDELFFILGADAFAEITLWRRWQEVMRLVEFIVVSRPGADTGQAPAEARVHWLDDVHVPASSTEIREQLRNGEGVGDRLPPAVLNYVREHGLYGCAAAGDARGSSRVARG
jgi:nicotinate-nucleotide adenylyltransferase